MFALNVFIIFLLAFENRITVPYWLQPIGRMHPMFLHFPIVILMLAMLLEFFRFRAEYSAQDLYQRFASNLLLIGAISSGVAVIMGLFLSKEDGYTGAALQWHKWTGVSVVFIASAIHWSRNSPWYKAPVARAGAIIIFFCLIFAGHYGATLTHGENFVLEPVMPAAKKVPIAQAIVFDHLIQPVFEKKCISCHNPEKLKGNLILADARSILKGGKTGKLFVAGKPELSLLLQRIHLPLEEKKHMPPKGKIQLSEDEIALLYYWIKANADFTKKVIELPVHDSLRILASALLKPAEEVEEQFDFAAADEETVRKLNNNYRVIYPISKGSPALAVNLYNKDTYTSQALNELSAVKKQIISLELNKLPVKDADLQYIGRFENLRKLNLNFTDITGKGLKELAQLKHLQSLSLSGTKVNYPDLQQQIGVFKSLNTLTVWNTEIKESEIKQLQKSNKHIELISGFRDDGKNPIQLTPPLLKNSSTIFSESLPVLLKHPIHGADIRYTTDGSEPDSVKSPVFRNKTILKENTVLKARAYKAGWLGSNVVAFNFYKSRYKPDSVILLAPFDENNQANGIRTFFDGQLGSSDLPKKSSSDKWAGFSKNNMELLLEFKKETAVSSVALNTMMRPEAGIYPPAAIEIRGGTSKTGMQLITIIRPPLPEKGPNPLIKVIECKFQPRTVSYLKIIAKPLKKRPQVVPVKKPPPKPPVKKSPPKPVKKPPLKPVKKPAEARKSKGKPPLPADKPALLFVDEIFIN